MKKLSLALLLLLFAWNAHAAIIAESHFDALTEGGWECHTYLQAPEIASVAGTPDPSNVLKINYPDGFTGGTNPSSCTTTPAGDYSSDEVYGQIYVYYPAAYQFHTVGNKISYTYLEKVGGDNPGNFFIAAMGDGGSRQIAIQTQPDNGDAGKTNEVFYANVQFINITTDTWYKIVWYVKLNTSGVSDGLVKIWVNDTLTTDRSDMNLRGGDTGTRKFYFSDILPIFGGTGETKSGADYYYFDHAIISTTAIGGGAGDVTDPYLNQFSPADGATGVAVGTTSVSWHFKDAGDGADSTSHTVACSSPSIATKTCGDANFACSGTSADITATLSGLSLSYDQAVSCTINGQDLAASPNVMSQYTYNFTVQADPNPSLAVTTTTLPNGTVGTAYSQTLAATGGTSPYTWDNTGVLPAGLALSSSGAITGTPTTAGVSAFTVTATDSGTPSTDNQALSITINAATPTGQTTVEITAITDTYIDSGAGADTNYSDNAAVRTYQWPSYTVANRGIYQFDLSSLPANISITAASLELYLTGYDSSGGTSPMRTYVRRITGTLPTLATVTWTTFAGTLGTAESYTDVSLTSGWYSFNVREMTGAAYTASANLYLSLDGGQDGASDTNRIFAAMDHGTAAYRPKLKVTYTQLTGPGERSPTTPGKVNVTANKINKFRSFR